MVLSYIGRTRNNCFVDRKSSVYSCYFGTYADKIVNYNLKLGASVLYCWLVYLI